MSKRYSPFGKDVYLRRIARARETLKAAGIEAAVIVALEHLAYFGGYDSWVGVNSPQALVLTASETPPTLLLRNVDLPLALETTIVEDIRTYHLVNDDFPSLVQAILAEKGVRSGQIGIEMHCSALTFALGRGIADALAPAELVDTTSVLGALRIIKEPAEIALIVAASRHAEMGLAAFRATARPGITEVALSAAIEAAVRGSGSDYWSIPVELASGPRSAGGHATARNRVLEPGDIVHTEFAGVSERYHAAAMQTIALGEPSARAREIYELGIRSLNAGIAEVRVGAAVGDIEEASLVPLRQAGLEHTAMMRFGYGIGLAYPPIWLEPLTIAKGFPTRLQPGMVFVLHACLELVDEGLGVAQGGTYLLEAGGLTMLAGAGSEGLLSVAA